jgi:nicotinate-nucleotide adenylyltransferase
MKTGLFFGSFNPIHIGHIAIAGFVLNHTDLEEVWFVVSPQNPLKSQSDLASDNHRLEMVRLALEDLNQQIKVCDIEMSMPRPSYTIDTVNLLKEKYPTREFAVIMGADSLDSITKWKSYEELLESNRIIVYPRIGSNLELLKAEYNIETVDAPQVEISSTFIRNTIAEEKSAVFYMPRKAFEYIQRNQLYK